MRAYIHICVQYVWRTRVIRMYTRVCDVSYVFCAVIHSYYVQMFVVSYKFIEYNTANPFTVVLYGYVSYVGQCMYQCILLRLCYVSRVYIQYTHLFL